MLVSFSHCALPHWCFFKVAVQSSNFLLTDMLISAQDVNCYMLWYNGKCNFLRINHICCEVVCVCVCFSLFLVVFCLAGSKFMVKTWCALPYKTSSFLPSDAPHEEREPLLSGTVTAWFTAHPHMACIVGTKDLLDLLSRMIQNQLLFIQLSGIKFAIIFFPE